MTYKFIYIIKMNKKYCNSCNKISSFIKDNIYTRQKGQGNKKKIWDNCIDCLKNHNFIKCQNCNIYKKNDNNYYFKKNSNICNSCNRRCKHKLRKRYCNICNPNNNMICKCNNKKTHIYDCIKCDGRNICKNIDNKGERCKMNKSNNDEDFCIDCYFFKYPNKIKRKEHIIRDRLSDINWTSKDKPIKGTKRRPDLLLDLKSHIIILEIDENQHKNYNKQCEITRINELVTVLGDRKIICLRFNCDKYILDNKKINSCFSTTKIQGKLKINEKELENRLELVREKIIYFSNYENIKNINKLYHDIFLYYDN